MSPIVRMTGAYDDTRYRKAVARFFESVNSIVKYNEQKAPIDLCVCLPSGKILMVEVASNSCSISQEKYPEGYIHIPWRKFAHFYMQVNDIPGRDISRGDGGYFALVNTDCTRIAFISFKSLVKFQTIPTYKCTPMDINGNIDAFVFVPENLVEKYRDIPPESQDTDVQKVEF